MQSRNCLEAMFQAESFLLQIHLQLVKPEPRLRPPAMGGGGSWPLWEREVALRDQERFHYLGVELPGIVQEGQADFLQSADFTRVVLEALEHATAHISSIHQTVLDLS